MPELAPKERTEPSDKRLTSSPMIASLTTESPPSVCNEPSVVDVASVASSVFKIPLSVPVVAASVPATVNAALPSVNKSVSFAAPIVPLFLIMRSSDKVKI